MNRYVVTGDILEVFKYESNIKNKGCPNGLAMRNLETSVDTQISNYNKTKTSRRNMIRRLANSNFNNKYDKFYTLTFKDDISDVQMANYGFKNFILRLKRFIIKNFPDYDIKGFKYIAVIEFQDTFDRGVVHYHMLCNAPYIDKYIIQDKIWQYGIAFITAITDVDNLGAYLVKYMTKDSNDFRLRGQKGYLYSKNLTRPLTYNTLAELNRKTNNKFKGAIPVYENEYLTSFLGECKYSQYNLNRKVDKC